MNPRSAFTLVEMTVALGVTAMLTVLMLQMFNDSSAIWKQHDDRLDTFREARAALQLMARELGTVMPLPDVPEKFPVLALRAHPDTASADEVNQEIYALTAVPNAGKSDFSAIGYFCEWVASRNCFILKRQFTDSDETFTRIKKTLDPASPQIVLPKNPADPAQRSSFTDGGNIAFKQLYSRNGSATVQDVASYIWDLKFVALVTVINPHTNTPVIDSATQRPKTKEVSWPHGAYECELPHWIEIRFKALGASAARKLEGQAITRETWFKPAGSAYQRLILPNEQHFVSRVKLTR